MSFLDRISPDLLMKLSTSVLPWIGPEGAFLLAQLGTGVGSEAYANIPAQMKRGPTTTQEAYAQAYYFTLLAAQRAIKLQDEGKVDFDAPLVFFEFLKNLNADVDVVARGVGTSCEAAGFNCPVRGASRVLKDTIDTIEASDLPDSDKAALAGPLRKNRSQVTLRQAIPYVVIFGIGGFLIHSYYQQRQIKMLRSAQA